MNGGKEFWAFGRWDGGNLPGLGLHTWDMRISKLYTTASE